MTKDRPVAAFEREPLSNIPRIVSIGSFDGVHRGHQLLLSLAVGRAHELGVESAIVTFEPVPAMVLRPDRFPGRICTPDEKFARLNQFGFDEILALQFDLDLAQKSPKAFLEWLSATTHLTELWVGEAFALGKNRVGDVERIRQIGNELGFSVTAVPRLTNGGDAVSSSAIRTAIHNGAMGRVHELLGQPFRISGEVV